MHVIQTRKLIALPDILRTQVTPNVFFGTFVGTRVQVNPWPTGRSAHEQSVLLCLENQGKCTEEATPQHDRGHFDAVVVWGIVAGIQIV